MQDALITHLQKQSETVVELQEGLVSRPALGPENGGQGEAVKAGFLRRELEKRSFPDIRELPAPDGRVDTGLRPNLAAFVPGRNPGGKQWIVSHMDVVPPGDGSLWRTDPYILHREGDRITGRGVEDNHHGLVASLLAAEAYLATGLSPKQTLGLLFVADEETGNAYGLDFLLQKHPELFHPDDAFLVPDFGRPDSGMIEVAEKGLVWLKFTVKGRQCHASTPDRGLNSLSLAAELIVRLKSLHEMFNALNSLFDPQYSTFEPTKKEANVPNVNTIPGQDVFYLDCRVLPDYALDDVLEAARTVCREVEQQSGAGIEVEAVHRTPSSSTDPDAPFIRRLSRCIEAVYKVRPTPRGIGGGTVASFPRRLGHPAAVWATLAGNAHQPNEYTSIQNIIDDAKVMSLLCSYNST